MIVEMRMSTLPIQPMYAWLKDLFPMNRSLTGEGVRKTLHYLQELVADLRIEAIPSGTRVFDWTIPREWALEEAWLIGPDGRTVVDFADMNLHVVGYSTPVDRMLELEALQPHLFSFPDQPDAIPYVTSYSKEFWGFCLPHRQRQELRPGNYRALIRSHLFDGVLNYGELILPGATSKEIFLSTYICHPSMANDNLSGPVVTAALARWLIGLPSRRYTYRIVFLPETIGAIAYLSRHLQGMKANIIAGWVVTCVGDDRTYSFLPSRYGNTLADRTARLVLKHHAPDHKCFSFLDRGSDERQYCAPGADLPVASIMRSKYGTYPEYHTSADNLDLVSQAGLAGAYEALAKCIALLESNDVFRSTTTCEPQLGRRGLYRTTSSKGSSEPSRDLLNILAYADGTNDVIALAEITNIEPTALLDTLSVLEQHGLLERLGIDQA